MKKITLKAGKIPAKSARRFMRDMERGAKEAMRESAMFGVAAAAKTAAGTKPRPQATGQYAQSWHWKKTRKGAIFGNTAKQSIWVEVGRKAGKAPPLEAIEEWVRVKRIHRTKKGALKKRHHAAVGARGRGSKAKRLAYLAKAERGTAFAIQAKIAKKGTPGRWVLKRTVPKIARHVKKGLKEAVAQAIERVRA